MQEFFDSVMNWNIPFNEYLLYGILAFFVVLSLICLIVIYAPRQKMPKMATAGAKNKKNDNKINQKGNVELNASQPATVEPKQTIQDKFEVKNFDNQVLESPDGEKVINLADFAVVYKPDLSKPEEIEEKPVENVVLEGQLSVEEQLAESEEDIKDEDETKTVTENGKQFQIVEKKSFQAKLIQSVDETKEYYAQVADYIVSFGVKNKFAWDSSMFINKDKKTLAKIGMRGKTLCLYLALLPKMFVDTKYRAKDVSATKKFAQTPLMVKVKSDRGVKFAKELVDEMMASFGLSANISFVPKVSAKMFPFDTTDKLIEKGLVKLVKTEVKPFPTNLNN